MRSIVLCMLAIAYSFGLDRVAGQDTGTPARSITFTVQTRDESDALKREIVAAERCDVGRRRPVDSSLQERTMVSKKLSSVHGYRGGASRGQPEQLGEPLVHSRTQAEMGWNSGAD